MDGKKLVDAVRRAASDHNSSWEALIPDAFRMNPLAEEAEEAAYEAMERVKEALRRHICDTYGISVRELSSLAMP